MDEKQKGQAAVKRRELLSDALVVAGAVAVSVGVGMLCLPAGIIVGGLGAIFIGWQISVNSS